jgi:hypothetical protein
MQAPSGYYFDDREVAMVRAMTRYGTLRYDEKPIVLSSGGCWDKKLPVGSISVQRLMVTRKCNA